MTATIDYYFWLNSDWAYLGADRLVRMASDHGARINWMPVDLPDVYRRTGGVLLGQRSHQRQAYRVIELRRWCRKLGIEVNPAPKYMCPDAGLASRIFIAAGAMGLPVHQLHQAILRAEWCEERDISDPSELYAILRDLGMDAEAIGEAAGRPETEAQYRRFTDRAVEAGVFGSPSYVVDGELFWGQDRLDMVEEQIARMSAKAMQA